MVRTAYLSAGAAGLLLALASFSPAQALSMKDCSVKYNAAKSAGTLNGQGWNDFRKTQCAADAAATPSAATPAATPAAAPAPAPAVAAPKPAAAAPAPAAPAPAAPKPAAAAPAPAAPTAAAPVATGNVVFPSAISPQYSTLSAGKARFKTCDDQYNANKATGGNGGLKWIEKGGGYYSECNKKLKG